MSQPIPAGLEALLAQFESDDSFWTDPVCLYVVLLAAKHHGLLPGVELHALLAESGCDERFLIVVEVAPDLRVASVPIPWREVMPTASRRGSDPLRALLEEISTIAHAVALGVHRPCCADCLSPRRPGG